MVITQLHIVARLISQDGWRPANHLVTRVKSNSVAYFPAPHQPSNRPRGRGRPKKYGNKILVAALLEQIEKLQQAPSPVYGEQGSLSASAPPTCSGAPSESSSASSPYPIPVAAPSC